MSEQDTSTITLPTFTEEYRTHDRSGFGSGPWDDEPDKVVWTDEATGLTGMALRNRFGAWCGYVGVPDGHPWHGKDYSTCIIGCDREYDYCDHEIARRIDVHGGLTFADACHDEAEDHTQAICHLADDGKPVWWFGFDTAHAGDLVPSKLMGRFMGDEYRDLPYIVGEVQHLARQLAEVAS